MARDYDRNYGDYRSRTYDRDDYRNRDRNAYRDDSRELYSGGQYFYEGRTYASDRNRRDDYGRDYPNERAGLERGNTYEDYYARPYETDYDRDRRSRYTPDINRRYGQNYDYGPSSYDRNRERQRNRYGYSPDYDPSRDWDYDPTKEYDRRGYRRYELSRRTDSWNGYGYGPEDEWQRRGGDYRSAYERGDYNRGEFDRTDEYWRGGEDRYRADDTYASRRYAYRDERDEDRDRRYDRNWGSINPNWQQRRETEPQAGR